MKASFKQNTEVIPGITQVEIEYLLEKFRNIVSELSHCPNSQVYESPLHHLMLLSPQISTLLYWYPDYGDHVKSLTKNEKSAKLVNTAGQIASELSVVKDSLSKFPYFSDPQNQLLLELFEQIEIFENRIKSSAVLMM